MTKLRDDEKLAKVARVLREGRDRLVEYVHAVQEDLGAGSACRDTRRSRPRTREYREGKLPPPLTCAALAKAVARLTKGHMTAPQRPAAGLPGPLFQRERYRTPLLRAVKRYKQLRELGLGSEKGWRLAVEWADENPLQHPLNLVQERCRGRVTVSQLRSEILKGKARRKLRELNGGRGRAWSEALLDAPVTKWSVYPCPMSPNTSAPRAPKAHRRAASSTCGRCPRRELTTIPTIFAA